MSEDCETRPSGAPPQLHDMSRITATIVGPPEHRGVPYRFECPSRGRGTFPHFIDKDSKYQVDKSRDAELAVKLDGLPDDSPLDALMELTRFTELSLEIEDAGEFRPAQKTDFPHFTQELKHEGRMPNLFSFSGPFADGDNTLVFRDIKLNYLSSQTMPRGKQLRFKVKGSCSEYGSCSEEGYKALNSTRNWTGTIQFEAHSIPFLSVAKTMSSKAAGKERADPRPLSGHAHETKQKREASARAAQAVHEKRFPTVTAAITAAEFAGATRRLVDKALRGLQQAVGTSSEQIEASDGEESGDESGDQSGEESGDESGDESGSASDEEHECLEEDSSKEGDANMEVDAAEEPAPARSEQLSRLRGESLPLCGSNGRHQRREQQVDSLFTEAIAVQEGLEGKGVDLGRAERARLAFDTRPLAPIHNAFDEATRGYIENLPGNLGIEGVLDDGAMDSASATLQSRVYNVRAELEQQESNLANQLAEVKKAIRGYIPTCSAYEACQLQLSNLEDEKGKVERKLKHSPKPRRVADDLLCAVRHINNAITLIKDPPADIVQQTSLMCGDGSIDIVRPALFSLTPPVSAATAFHWSSFVRKARNIREDFTKDSLEPTRCDASFLSDMLDADDIDALRRAADLLKRLAKGCEATEHMPLAVQVDAEPASMQMDAPPDMTPNVAIYQPPQEGKTCVALPPFDAIDGSAASALMIPSLLYMMPRAMLLRFVAEKVPLPSTPRGSELLAKRALPDMLRLLDGFLADPKPRENVKWCPFRGPGEMHETQLTSLKKMMKAAVCLLRGKTMIMDEEAAGPADPPPFSYSKVKIDKEKTGVRGDENTGFEGCIVCTFEFGGKEYEYEYTTKDDHLRLLSEEENDTWCNNELNRKYAKERAQRKLNEMVHKEMRREESARVQQQQQQWSGVQTRIYAELSMSTNAKNSSPELAALRNAASNFAKVSICGNGYLRSTLPTYRKDSKREDKKSYSDRLEQTVAPVVHLSKECLLQGLEKADERTATAVLKTISSKAGLGEDLQNIGKNIPKPVGSSAKGKRTTERHQLIEIYDFGQLVSIAEVVIDAIKLFRDESRSADQEDWCIGRKRKRS